MAIDLSRLRAMFLEELEEHHSTLQHGLLQLERHPGAAGSLLPELFRAAHSLKGGAQAVRLPAMATLCHRLEDALSSLRDGTVTLTPELHSSLLAEVDTLADLAGQLRDGLAEGQAPDRPIQPASATASPSPAPPGQPPPAPRTALRVPTERLDALLERAGDVLLARDQLAGLVRDSRDLAEAAAVADRRWRDVRPHLTDGLEPCAASALAATDRAWRRVHTHVDALQVRAAATARTLHEGAAGLEHSTKTLRLQPFRVACEGLDRAVRDLTSNHQAGGKKVTLDVHGADAELDSDVVTALREPLLHLVRNAVAHGIESVEIRHGVGKPETGTVTVTAHILGDQVTVRVADDGAGLIDAALRQAAGRRGIDLEDTDDAAFHLAWLPGLSTASTADELAGRGVGLDAVRSRVEQLGGSVELTSTTGQGCEVTLHLPVTLTTLHVLIVAVADETLALPSAAVRRVVRIPTTSIHTTGGRLHAIVDDEPASVVSLRALLGLAPAPARDHQLAVLVTDVSGSAVLLVDQVIDARRITRRRLNPRLDGAPGLLGSTLLPTGDAAFVVNPLACLRSEPGREPTVLATDGATTQPRAPRVLLAEDSATTRALERDILERAGYEVLAAADGAEAWRLLGEQGADLVVTDIEMPGMDGFALCQAIREHPRLGELPVVLVTSRASDEDRHRGVEVGANAYLVKGGFEQSAFLATIGRLL